MEPKKSTGRTLKEELEIRQRWKDVLLAFYSRELFISREWEWKGTGLKDNPSVKKLGLSEDELIHALFYLKNNGLIEFRQDSLFMELSGKGFDVAGKIEEQRETRLYRLSSLVFSEILMLTILTALIHQMHPAYSDFLLATYTIILVVILFVYSMGIRKIKE